MLKKVWMYGIVGALALALIGGSMYVVLRPSDVQAERGWESSGTEKQTAGYRGGEGTVSGRGAEKDSADECDSGKGQGQAEETRGRRNSDTQSAQGITGGGQGRGQATASSNTINDGEKIMRGQGAVGIGRGEQAGGQGANIAEPVSSDDWETVEGIVTVSDGEMTVQTDAGEIVVGMGQSWYREEADFAVEVGDEVRVHGYAEEGEFKAGTVENLTTGQRITLRDNTGRPMWAGRGNLKNQP